MCGAEGDGGFKLISDRIAPQLGKQLREIRAVLLDDLDRAVHLRVLAFIGNLLVEIVIGIFLEEFFPLHSVTPPLR
ncbi:hypothetical protein D9M71_827480 [compost metagenome]